MALGAYQKMTRVVSGKPFGNGSDGAYSSATIPTMVKESCSGSSGGTALTCASTTLSNGDIILIYQIRGTGVGQWEINKVASGGGTTSIVLTKNLQYTYTDSGASQAQATVIKQYTDVTVQTGTWTLTDWAGNTGGILVFAANGTVTITGTITGTGKGFRGGAGGTGNGSVGSTGIQGESHNNTGSASTSANNGGGGGGQGNYDKSHYAAGGGGAGYGAAGSTGGTGTGTPDSTPGTGGGTYGVAALTSSHFGSGGGGGGADWPSAQVGGAGGDGGGAILIFGENLVVTGANNVNGSNGGATTGGNNNAGGGGGSGGSVMLQVATATLGSNKITATAGTGSAASDPQAGAGGNGGVGRIAVHHSGTVTGTTNPTFDDTEDSSLVVTAGNFLAFL